MLLKTAFIAALGYAGYRYLKRDRASRKVAFAAGQGAEGNFSQVRDAGPAAMADGSRETWSKVDQRSDESFPASDPPATY